MRLRIGGATILLRAVRPTSLLHPPPALAPFLARRGADLVVDLEPGTGPEPEGAPLFASGGLWSVWRHGRGLLYEVREPVPGAAPRARLAADPRRTRARLWLPGGPAPGQHFALEFPLDEILFQHHLCHAGAVEVHAAAVEWEGQVLLFCGSSGAGKTTTARLWRRRRPAPAVLSDDRVVVRLLGGRAWAFGTPWHGSGRYASPAGRPLAGLFFLEQAPASEARVIGVAPAAAALAAHAFTPAWERPAVAAALATCARVAARVPAAHLRFRPDRSAVEAVLGFLGPAHK